MKLISLLTLITLSFIVLACSNEKTTSMKSQDVIVKLSSNSINLDLNSSNKKTPLSINDLIEIYGKPRFTKTLASKIATWDDLGFHAYTGDDEKTITALTYSFVKETFEFSPKTLFKGNIYINGELIPHTMQKDVLVGQGYTESKYVKLSFSKELENRAKIHISVKPESAKVTSFEITLKNIKE